MKAVIFGANGQDGYYISQACRKKQIEVIGISRNGPWLKGDVADVELVNQIIKEHRPQMIFHLAASSTTRHDVIYENHASIGTGTINILESVKRLSLDSKVFIAGSGLQFVNNGMQISEKDNFDHSSCYVAVRNYAVYLARYFRSIGIKVYVGYLFHHESPLRDQQHTSQKIAQAVMRIAKGSAEKIELGDISVKKEWTFAGDIAEGILTLMEQDKISEAVIGSGEAYSIEQWLDRCFKLIGKDWRDYVTQIENFRPEYKLLVSNPETINSLGWKASTSIDELAKIMITI